MRKICVQRSDHLSALADCGRHPLDRTRADIADRKDTRQAGFERALDVAAGANKTGCRACAGAVIQAAAPERLIRAGLPTEAMVAHVLVSKYAWHLPLYRQVQILLAQGIEIDRSTLAFWVGYAAAELMPLWRRLREILLGSPRLFVDETRAPVLDPGRGRTKTGYFWSIARDDSAWQGDTGPPGRGAEHAINLLAGYSGIVQCDGYAAYKQVAHRGRTGNAVILAFCWSHWRRRFYEIARAGSAPIATEALQRLRGDL